MPIDEKKLLLVAQPRLSSRPSVALSIVGAAPLAEAVSARTSRGATEEADIAGQGRKAGPPP